MIIRPIAALAVSAIIAGGTYFTVAKTNDEAQRTANDITEQVLDAQKQMTENAHKQASQSAADAKRQANDVLEAAKADSDVPDAAKAQLEAAQEQIDAATADLD
jgi:hypothetical protein